MEWIRVRFYYQCLGAMAFSATLLVGCQGTQSSINPDSSELQKPATDRVLQPMDGSGYRVLYNFDAVRSDEAPEGGVTAMDGMLYGTTTGGFGATPPGTVFRVDPATGLEKVLYYFYWGVEGSDPRTGLIAVNGKLYGTTSSAGAHGCGTVFV